MFHIRVDISDVCRAQTTGKLMYSRLGNALHCCPAGKGGPELDAKTSKWIGAIVSMLLFHNCFQVFNLACPHLSHTEHGEIIMPKYWKIRLTRETIQVEIVWQNTLAQNVYQPTSQFIIFFTVNKSFITWFINCTLSRYWLKIADLQVNPLFSLGSTL